MPCRAFKGKQRILQYIPHIVFVVLNIYRFLLQDIDQNVEICMSSIYVQHNGDVSSGISSISGSLIVAHCKRVPFFAVALSTNQNLLSARWQQRTLAFLLFVIWLKFLSESYVAFCAISQQILFKFFSIEVSFFVHT